MSKIDDLIAKLCPNGVEYKKLGEVCIILDHLRKPISKENRKKGNIPYYGANGIQDYVFDYIFEGEYLLFGEDGSVINKDNSPILNWAEGKIWVNNHAHVLSENIEIAVLRYVYFYLQTIDVSDIVRGTPPKINQTNLRNIPIPVPPLEIQREIVNVLDTFTKLEAELEAELEARRRQYHHYRDQLLNLEGRDDVQWMTLGEVAINQDSKRRPVTKSARNKGEIPYYGASGIVDYVSDYIFDGDFLLVSEDGANLIARSTPIAFSISGKTWVNNHAHVLQFNSYAERKFIEIYLNSIDLTPYISGGAQPKLNQANLNKIPIPVPSLEEQTRIVAILDKFDALVNDLSSGLPAEIAARRKQYEYYRDRLLTFKEAQ